VCLWQFRDFSNFENFQAQTWVEHAIFALRERRLTTWPLRLATTMKLFNVTMSIINAHVSVICLTSKEWPKMFFHRSSRRSGQVVRRRSRKAKIACSTHVCAWKFSKMKNSRKWKTWPPLSVKWLLSARIMCFHIIYFHFCIFEKFEKLKGPRWIRTCHCDRQLKLECL
jgi:hypothetical protein